MDDLIRRSDALKELWYPFDFNRAEIDINIKHIPAVDAVEVKHGYWKTIGYKRARICSCCEKDEPYKFADDDVDVFSYCPYCGARMDGRRKEDDT